MKLGGKLRHKIIYFFTHTKKKKNNKHTQAVTAFRNIPIRVAGLGHLVSQSNVLPSYKFKASKVFTMVLQQEVGIKPDSLQYCYRPTPKPTLSLPTFKTMLTLTSS